MKFRKRWRHSCDVTPSTHVVMCVADSFFLQNRETINSSIFVRETQAPSIRGNGTGYLQIRNQGSVIDQDAEYVVLSVLLRWEKKNWTNEKLLSECPPWRSLTLFIRYLTNNSFRFKYPWFRFHWFLHRGNMASLHGVVY